MNEAPVSRKKVTFGIIFAIVAVVCLIFSNKLVETVEKGTYDVIQRPVTGTMEAKMDTGMYMQGFSDVFTWPTSETFFFISDDEEGTKHDQSIEVRFNDGSVAKISGTCRVLMPTSETEAIYIMTGMNFKDYADLEARFIRPIVRNAMRLTANLMTARESYAEKRPDFITYSWDQIQNGTFQTEEKTTTIKDPISGQMVTKSYKVIKKDKDGNPLRDQNPLHGTGITLANFEIKQFVYEEKVRKQISEQQENLMAIATARAQAERAEQDAKTSEARGKTEVMKVRYEQLKEKEKAVIMANQEKEVAETQAQKELEVAKLARLAAEQEKERQILLGKGESERKKLVMAADGALKQKLETLERIQAEWAKAYATRQVPKVYMSGGSDAAGGTSPDDEFKRFMNMMNIQAAKQLSLDMTIKGDTSGK
jgi:regulator of protease activity HflC (stomatin/prohibitin superfamily)